MKNIKVNDENWSKLQRIKIDHKFKTIDQSVTFLFEQINQHLKQKPIELEG